MAKKRRRGEPAGEAVRRSRLEMVRRILDGYELEAGKALSIADLVRLLSLERELEGEELVREVKVAWVRPFETES
jgi:hypothetical protein